MVPRGERRGGPESGEGDLEGRDLLVGRPEGAAPDRPTAEATDSPAAPTAPTTSLLPAAHDDSIREVLATVRATAARIDALQDAPGPEHETAEALARATAALTRAVGNTRGALAKAGEVAERRDGAAEAARVLAEGVAALKTQGEALDQRIRATGTQAEVNARQAKETGRQAEVTAQGMAEMKQTATKLDSSLRIHAENMFRINQNQRWRRWLTGLAIAAASFVFFSLGAVLQREVDIVSFGDPRHEWNEHVVNQNQRWRRWLTGLAIAAASFVFFSLGAVLQREVDIVSFGDPRHEWNEHVVEHFAPLLAACASKARLDDKTVWCRIDIYPSREVTIPFYPGGTLSAAPSEEHSDPAAER